VIARAYKSERLELCSAGPQFGREEDVEGLIALVWCEKGKHCLGPHIQQSYAMMSVYYVCFFTMNINQETLLEVGILTKSR
jgi:hypothetical protein